MSTTALRTLNASTLASGQAAASITPARMLTMMTAVADAIDAGSSPAETTLTFSASIAWNGTNNAVTKVTMGGNATITFSGGVAGSNYRLAVIQDGTGSRVPTLAGVTLLGTPVWQTAPGAINLVTIDMVGSTAIATVQ